MRRKTEIDVIRQLWRETERTEDGCWIWQKSLASGYGQMGAACITGVAHLPVRTHVLSWHIFKGEVPAGLHIHHKCENKACCNPDHLELLAPAEHRYRHVDPDYCPQGHAFTPENTGHHKNGKHRVCKKCDAERKARMRAAHQSPCVWCGTPAYRDPRRRADKPAECKACYLKHAVPNPNGPGRVSYFLAQMVEEAA